MVGLSSFVSFFVLAQAAAPEPDMMQTIVQFAPFLVIGVLFWVLMIRPESKKTADQNKMREGLKKNDRVLTIGGIFGTVVNVQKDAKDITIRVDEGNNTRLRVLRSSIALILAEGDEGDAAKAPEPQ